MADRYFPKLLHLSWERHRHVGGSYVRVTLSCHREKLSTSYSTPWATYSNLNEYWVKLKKIRLETRPHTSEETRDRTGKAMKKKKRKKRGKKKRKSGSEVKWVSGESQEHCYRMSLSPLAEDRGNWIEEIEHPFATLTSPMCFRKRAWIYRRLESLLGRVSLGYTLFEIRPL